MATAAGEQIWLQDDFSHFFYDTYWVLNGRKDDFGQPDKVTCSPNGQINGTTYVAINFRVLCFHLWRIHVSNDLKFSVLVGLTGLECVLSQVFCLIKCERTNDL